MSIINTNEDLEMLYEMEGETLKGIIYEPEESDNLMLVFDKHTINISGDGGVSVKKRSTTPDSSREHQREGALNE